MKSLHKLIANHAKLLQNYHYTYISSTALFLLLPGYKGTPSDFDIALNWQGKGKKEFLELYRYIKKQPGVVNVGCKAIEEQTTANYIVKKNQHIYIKDPLLETLLIQGNIKLTYDYQTMPVELFPEQEGNGVTNIDICNPCIHHQEINGIQVPVLDIMEVAKRYVINLIDEITNKKLSNIKHPDYKHKDALRLNTIIQILYVSNKDASPKGVIKFIKNYITSLKKHIPPKKRSIFIQTILRNYSKVYKKISYMAKLYNKLTIKQLEGTKEVDFSKFHEDLKKELTKIYDIVDAYQKKLLHNIYIKKTNLFKEIQEAEGEKIQHYLQKINLTNKINSFAYFYEFYSIMDMLKIFL